MIFKWWLWSRTKPCTRRARRHQPEQSNVGHDEHVFNLWKQSGRVSKHVLPRLAVPQRNTHHGLQLLYAGRKIRCQLYKNQIKQYCNINLLHCKKQLLSWCAHADTHTHKHLWCKSQASMGSPRTHSSVAWNWCKDHVKHRQSLDDLHIEGTWAPSINNFCTQQLSPWRGFRGRRESPGEPSLPRTWDQHAGTQWPGLRTQAQPENGLIHADHPGHIAWVWFWFAQRLTLFAALERGVNNRECHWCQWCRNYFFGIIYIMEHE